MVKNLKNKEKVFPFIVIALIVVLGSFYCLSLSNFQKEKYSLQSYYLKELSNLMLDNKKLIKENRELKEKNSNLEEENEQPDKENYVEVVAPNGGETLCIGKETKIKWKSKGIDTISIRVVEERGEGNYYHYIGMDSLPATYNETNTSGEGNVVWKVKDIPEGHYKLEIFMDDLKDRSDSPFSIIKCQG